MPRAHGGGERGPADLRVEPHGLGKVRRSDSERLVTLLAVGQQVAEAALGVGQAFQVHVGQLVQARHVEPRLVRGDQLVVRALLHDVTVLHHEDEVGVPDRHAVDGDGLAIGGGLAALGAELAPGFELVADEVGLSMAQLAVAWVLQNSNVAAAIIGASRPEQVEENVKASGVTLEPQVLAQIDAVLGEHVERDAGLTEANAPKRRPS